MSVVSAASSGRQSFGQQSYTGLRRPGLRGKGRILAASAAPSRSVRAVPQPPKVSAIRRTSTRRRQYYEDEQDGWSSTSSDSSRPCKRRGKDWYNWNKPFPPSCYPSTVSIPISGYGYYPTTYYSYSMPYPYVPALPYLNMPYPNPYGACNSYFPSVPAATTVNTLTDTVCGTQGCTTISQPVVTSCTPFGCGVSYGPPNLASISDSVFKRNLF
jgi:hypothetical protein